MVFDGMYCRADGAAGPVTGRDAGGSSGIAPSQQVLDLGAVAAIHDQPTAPGPPSKGRVTQGVSEARPSEFPVLCLPSVSELLSRRASKELVDQSDDGGFEGGGHGSHFLLLVFNSSR